ncbi:MULTISPECIES: OsmC family protein [unclassified Sphingomonas]|jgi:putative redox protein|uniref:OsmC family protein n=1 Tax=unclassified Sphingomonas TaxID=196159 RepID=UPI0013008613|nr:MULTISPECIES: OsmC family protein [unclassified Sphingomonas]
MASAAGADRVTETHVTYEGDLRCRAEHAGSGAVVVTDAPRDLGGREDGFSPSELLSVSLGGCILSIMAIAARSVGFDIPGASVTVTKEMADRPRRIARLAVHVRVPRHVRHAAEAQAGGRGACLPGASCAGDRCADDDRVGRSGLSGGAPTAKPPA